MKILHTADLHLGKTNFGLKDRLLDFIAVLDQIETHIMVHEVDLLVLSGDVFDSPDPDPYSTRALRQFLERIKTPCMAIAGNHDRHRTVLSERGRVTRLESLSDLLLPRDTLVSVLPQSLTPEAAARAGKTGLRVYGADWMPASRIPAFLASLPMEIDVLVMHQSCSGFLPKVAQCEMELESLAGKAKYVALGDLHVTKQMRLDDGTIVAYPGSTELCAIDEEPEKTVTLIDYDLSLRAVTSTNYLRLQTRPVTVIKVETPEQLTALGTAFPLTENSLVVVKYGAEFTRGLQQTMAEVRAQHPTVTFVDQSIPHVIAEQSYTSSLEAAQVEMTDILAEQLADHPTELQAALALWANPDNADDILNELQAQTT